MAFTSGVLIHIEPERLGATMDEIHRVSSKYILCAEYFSPRAETLRYRGQEGLLFKNDFGGLNPRRDPIHRRRSLEPGGARRRSNGKPTWL